MSDVLRRPVCDVLGCTYPVVLAGMGGPARSELVIAVTKAGGFGFLGMVREPPSLIRSEVGRVRGEGIQRFGVNLIPAATDPGLLDEQITTCIELKVPVVGLFWDLATNAVRRLKDAGVVVVCQVGDATEAVAAHAAGAQVIIAQGVEAGGHVRGTQPLEQFLPDVVAGVNGPVLAAGGIVDGEGLVAALALGAQGVVVGTAFLATFESFAHAYHKQRIVSARDGETVLTTDFHINWPAGAQVRVLTNSVTRGEHGNPYEGERRIISRENDRPVFLFSTDSPLRSMSGDFEAMALYAGMGAGRIDAVVTAGARLRAIVNGAEAILSADIPEAEEPDTFASPVCYAHEMESGYMGYARPEDLIVSLNALLEAERAGARVAMRSAAECDDPALKGLIAHIRRDEARWCGVLTRAVQMLNGTPSVQTGNFYKRAMDIADLRERLVFLNRGQAWVVKKLTALLPTVRDAAIYNGLAAMLRSHEKNIVSVENIWKPS